MNKSAKTGVLASFRVSSEIDEVVEKIALGEGKTKSAVFRDLIDKGLIAGGYRSGCQDMAALVRQAVDGALKPQTERLAAISAKAAQISAAAYFLAAYSGKQTLPAELREDFEAVAAHARKLGIEYLKLSKDRSLDEFIAGGLKRMDDTL